MNSQQQINLDLSNFFKKSKKSKKSTSGDVNIQTNLDNIQSLGFDDTPNCGISSKTDIVISEPIQNQVDNVIIDNIDKSNKKKSVLKLGLDFISSAFGNNEKSDEINEEVHERLDTVPEEVDIVKTAEVLTEKVLPEIPDGDSITELDDLEISVKKDKSGYIKSKVTVKGSVRLSDLATEIKKLSNGDVIHRSMDLRNIANTNKNQLKDSEYKLYSKSYNFKSKSINKKYNRICLSLIDNDPNNVILFFQSGADKAIYKLKFNDKFIIDLIANYYVQGFNATKFKIDNLENPVPYLSLANKIASTGKYKIKVLPDGIAVIGKGNKNFWLMVGIKWLEESNEYVVFGKSLIERDWKGIQLINGNQSLERLLTDNFLNLLDDWFNYHDFSDVYNIEDDDNKYFYMAKKLKYRKLKDAFDKILFGYVLDEDENKIDNGIDIVKTLSREDIDDRISGEYNAEVIIGTSQKFQNWLLVYSAVQVIGGDKRNGRDFITTQQYYDKEGVSDRSQYQNRRRTVLKKQNTERNYNSRPYMFTLNIKRKDGEILKYQSKNFDDLIKYFDNM